MTGDLVPVPEGGPRQREKPSGKAEISERLEAALVNLVTTSCSKKQAAETAGLTREYLSRALSKAHVQARFLALMRERLSAMAPRALDTVEDLLTCDSSYVRLQSAVTVLDRIGLGTVEAAQGSTEVIINIDLS
jgi:hypothetical protein